MYDTKDIIDQTIDDLNSDAMAKFKSDIKRAIANIVAAQGNVTAALQVLAKAREDLKALTSPTELTKSSVLGC